MTLANCLNLPYKVFKQFACFSDALYLFFNSVKYFNKPKPCGVFLVFFFFFRFFFFFFNALTVPGPSHLPCYFGCHFFSSSVFHSFDVSLWFLSDHLTCGYVLPPVCFLIHSINVFNKSFCCGNWQK